MKKVNIQELCKIYNLTGSWKKVSEIKNITPEHISTVKKKHIKMVAVVK